MAEEKPVKYSSDGGDVEREVEKVATLQKNSSNITEQKLSPEYIYTTNQSVEDFGNVPFKPIATTRNTLSPPSPFIPKEKRKVRVKDYTGTQSVEQNSYCDKNPSDPRCHDEVDNYKKLGLFAEEVKYIFDPEERTQNTKDKPVQNLYETTRDNTQLDSGKVIRTECMCKDGRKMMGWLDIRSGQKDCSPCNNKVFNSPNPYKNYKTKRSTPNFSGKSVPLRKQVGVSHFGDVEMQGCQTGNASQSLEQRNKVSTLNNITNIDTRDSIEGSTITASQNKSGLPISLYDNLTTNVYGL